MSDNPLLKGKVPARYIGEHSILLSPLGKPYFDAQGKPLQSLVLRKGDTLYINEGEARGESWLHDPAREKDSLWLGTGKRVKEEHKDLSEEEHIALGYEWHGGRRDFIEITSDGKPVKQSTQAADPSQIKDLSAIAEPLLAEDAGYSEKTKAAKGA
jgi:hypothetical protein